MAEPEKSGVDGIAAAVSSSRSEEDHHLPSCEVHEKDIVHQSIVDLDAAEVVIPNEDAELIDPRLKDYPIPLVAKTVDLHNDPTYAAYSPDLICLG